MAAASTGPPAGRAEPTARLHGGVPAGRPPGGSTAAAMGLATRVGGRAFILRALIDTDRVATFRWLADHAAWWAARHGADDPPLAGVARHWLARVQASSRAIGRTPVAGT
jgi:hypothetical protein